MLCIATVHVRFCLIGPNFIIALLCVFTEEVYKFQKGFLNGLSLVHAEYVGTLSTQQTDFALRAPVL